MNKISRWLVVVNLIGVLFFVSYFNYFRLYDCGRLDDKPMLALGVSPKWFGTVFQLNIGYKSIVSNALGDEPFFDEAVSGANLFKTITAYNYSSEGGGVFFRAIDWEGVNRVFFLSENNAEIGGAYKVELVEIPPVNPKWVAVDQFSCRVGAYGFWGYLILTLILMLNLVAGFKALLRQIIK